MRNDLPESLDKFMDEQRNAVVQDNWQDDLVYGCLEINISKILNDIGLDSELSDFGAQTLLDKVAKRMKVPAVQVARTDMDLRGPDFAYSCRDNVVYKRNIVRAETMSEKDVIHEFTHYWLCYSFAFQHPESSCSTALTAHGGIFVQAYIEMLKKHFSVSKVDLQKTATQCGIYTARAAVTPIWKKWLSLDFSQDSLEQRKAISELISLDVPQRVAIQS